MPFTDLQKSRIRHHLGYPQVRAMAAAQFGIPRPLATNFILETAMDQIMEVAVPAVVAEIGVLDSLEQKLVAAQAYLVAEKLEELTLAADHPQKLEEEYNRWAKRLADDLGVPLYGFSARFKAGEGSAGNAVGVKNLRRG